MLHRSPSVPIIQKKNNKHQKIKLILKEKHMYCPKCGTPNQEDANYCKKCGSTFQIYSSHQEQDWEKHCENECSQGSKSITSLIWGILIIILGIWIIFTILSFAIVIFFAIIPFIIAIFILIIVFRILTQRTHH